MVSFVLVLLGFCVGTFALPRGEEHPAPVVPKLKTFYYEQQLDHFSYGHESKTFPQKYLINDEHWNRTGGPIFFYAGNEGAIELFADNSGFMFDIAPEFQAMLLFAEHRYYGSSMPFGNQSYSHKQYYQFQGSMQALADYAELLTSIRKTIQGAEHSPIIVFGGSYGGMLAAWMRIKYPHVVEGAIAASAPVAQFTGLTPCEDFGKLVTEVFRNASQDCADIIRHSWKAVDDVTATDEGKAWLADAWKLCDPVKTPSDIVALKTYLMNVWTNLAMANYPYAANFLAPLPPYPVKQTCSPMRNILTTKPLLTELFKGLSVYFNTTTTSKCQAYKAGGQPARLSDDGWYLQTCTEMVMPFCYNNKDDFFEASQWSEAGWKAECEAKWGTTPEVFKMQTIYGGRDLLAASNIVFSNGGLDPWSTGGIVKDISDSVITCFMKDGAHHIDLRAAEAADPADVVGCRNVHKKSITRWIEKFRKQLA